MLGNQLFLRKDLFSQPRLIAPHEMRGKQGAQVRNPNGVQHSPCRMTMDLYNVSVGSLGA